MLRRVLVASLWLSLCSTLLAQTPATSFPDGRRPIVAADGRVTFSLQAPSAQKVTLRTDEGEFPMQRNASGEWEAVAQLTPELHEYYFLADGLPMVDPRNGNIGLGSYLGRNFVEVRGATPLLHEIRNVPHGALRIETIHSQVVGRAQELRVYVPPRYESARTGTYPVLYLLHGAGGSEASWTTTGRAQMILDNLIADNKAVPMIVVMPLAHALPSTGSDGDPSYRLQNLALFERELLTEIKPFIEANYRVRKGPQETAIAGLSMGSRQAMAIGLNHLDQFAWIGGFSSPVDDMETALARPLSNPGQTNARLRLLWMSVGKQDMKERIDGIAALSKLLTSKGIPHVHQETEGGHTVVVWRKNLAQFAPLLFRARSEHGTR